MTLTIKAEGKTYAGPPVDWQKLKEQILGHLDVAAEFAALGVEFTQRFASKKGWRDCRAIHRVDKDPSAGVNVVTGIYKSHGDGAEVLDLFNFALKYGGGQAGATWKDVLTHYAEKAGVDVPFVKRAGDKGILEVIYPYVDAQGELLYEALRYRRDDGTKTFRQRRPDGRGGYIPNIDGVAPVPYRLPDLLASAPHRVPVFVLEGEKDVERAYAVGLVATTGTMGTAGTKSWGHLAPYLAGRHVFIIPDNDAAGRKHAEGVAAHLKPHVAGLKVLDLPGLPQKGDLSDWLDSGHSPDELWPLAAAAPTWKHGAAGPPEPPAPAVAAASPAPRKRRAVVVRVSDVEQRQVEWLWLNRLAIGKVSLIAGDPSQGKSFLTVEPAARVTTGTPWPDTPSTPNPIGSVLMLAAEDDLADTIAPRLERAGADISRVHVLTSVELADGRAGVFTLADLELMEEVLDERPDIRLIVIDPVTAYVGSTDDHRNSELRGLLTPLSELAARRRVAIVLITHLNKSTGTKALARVTGSLAYTAVSRSSWLVVRDSRDKERRLLLSIKANLCKDPNGLAYRIDDSGRVVWEEGKVMTTASEALSDPEPKAEAPDQDERAQAFLRELLTAGPQPSKAVILPRAVAARFRKVQMFKAKDAMGVDHSKFGEDDFLWSLPPAPPAGPDGDGEDEVYHSRFAPPF